MVVLERSRLHLNQAFHTVFLVRPLQLDAGSRTSARVTLGYGQGPPLWLDLSKKTSAMVAWGHGQTWLLHISSRRELGGPPCNQAQFLLAWVYFPKEFEVSSGLFIRNITRII